MGPAEQIAPSSLPDGVMAAQVTLTHLVMVRIHVGQPLWFKTRTSTKTVEVRVLVFLGQGLMRVIEL